jgi:hypothetical protein
LKYKKLKYLFQRVLNVKCFVILVIIGATGVVTNGWEKRKQYQELNQYILQKAAVLGTSHDNNENTIYGPTFLCCALAALSVS